VAVLIGDRSDKWQGVDRLILVHGRVYEPPDSPCLMAILTGSHGMGHEGAEKMLHLLRADLFVPNAHMVVCDHVRSCSTCQKNKTEQLHLAGLLQPLPVPSAVWCDIAMDFIEGLLRINDKSVILTMVDQLSRYVHFITLGHPYTATLVARAFFDSIARLHGVPGSIVSDRDSVFTSKFWTMLFTLADVRLNMMTTFHPQADGQTEATNKIIVMYLCCLTGDQPQHWLQWLPWAEFCYNSSFQASLCTSLFWVVYKRDPPSLCSYQPGDAHQLAVDAQLRDRDEFLMEVRKRIEQAQHHYKMFYDRHQCKLEFVLGQWAWLRLLHRPMVSLAPAGKGKLGPKFFGPFKVLERVCDVS
jgi:hypothetical protein